MDFVELLENIRGKSDADLLHDVKLVVQDVSGVERGAMKGKVSRDKDILKNALIKPVLSVCALMVFKTFVKMESSFLLFLKILTVNL